MTLQIRRRLSTVACVVALVAATAAAQEILRPVKPAPAGPAEKASPGLTRYMGREIAQTMHFAGAPWLTRDSRDREEEPAKLMKALDLKAGQTVCDLGCGNGFYTLRLADAVGPTGRVLAVEIQQEMLDLLARRAAKTEHKNIVPILGTVADPKLPENACDLVLLVDVYHEVDHPVEVLAGIRKGLKPSGRMVLVEFRAEDPNVPIKPEHKMSKAQILKEIPANGFKLVREFDELPWQHVMYFERDEGWKGPAPKE
jgi:predicted methyltransferase